MYLYTRPMEHNGWRVGTQTLTDAKGPNPTPANPSSVVNAANSNTGQRMNRLECNDTQKVQERVTLTSIFSANVQRA